MLLDLTKFQKASKSNVQLKVCESEKPWESMKGSRQIGLGVKSLLRFLRDTGWCLPWTKFSSVYELPHPCQRYWKRINNLRISPEEAFEPFTCSEGCMLWSQKKMFNVKYWTQIPQIKQLTVSDLCKKCYSLQVQFLLNWQLFFKVSSLKENAKMCENH